LNATINQFLDVARHQQNRRSGLRADAAGTFARTHLALADFERQGSSLPVRRIARYLASSAISRKLRTNAMFSKGPRRVKACWRQPNHHPEFRAGSHDRSAGRTGEADTSDALTQLVEDMIRIFESQR